MCDAVFDETNGSQKEQVDLDLVDDEEAPCNALQRMVIDDVRPQDPSNQPQETSPNDTTPPAQGLDQGQEESNDQGQEESNDQRGDEDDGDKEEAPRHPRVRQNIQRDHPIDNIHGNIKKRVTTRSRVANFCEHYSFVSSFEPFKVEDALRDLDWVVAMQEELNNFKHNEVWSLVERSKQNVVGTKWVFRNKQDEHGVVTRNKARLVAKDYSQVESLDFDETFAPVRRLESIHMLLAYATHHGFKLYQMDVKSTFLNGPIKEELYVEQPPGFESEGYPNHVYKLHKTLYGLKQAPRAWYECLRDFLIENSFRIGKVDSTLFTRKMGKDLFVCQIYVNDIIFGSTNKSFCDEFSKIMTDSFEISKMGVLTFFFGFQIKQAKEGTFISQTKYTCDILKKFGMDKAKSIKMPMGTNGHLDLDLGGTSVDQKVYRSMIGSLLYLCASRSDIMLSMCMCARFQAAPKDYHLRAVKRIMRYLVLTPNLGLWYPQGSHFELLRYSDVDYAGCKVDRKSTSGTCQFLVWSLISSSSKKQNSVTLSTVEAEYVTAGSYCAQLLWI
jgi:hypothetical protein